ncbi:hypothetical protein DFH08DRAFT_812894 [Mycena albidolilacea]|uniref:Uncharacterized protein n=1 Tax=Mycena albidolilacea TaxID=1033008 RepID=A0AAD6ZT91_9AGAR|nr:hypothetical protein DFH08DRAFT_812894 [Mycena albidolilacea]
MAAITFTKHFSQMVVYTGHDTNQLGTSGAEGREKEEKETGEGEGMSDTPWLTPLSIILFCGSGVVNRTIALSWYHKQIILVIEHKSHNAVHWSVNTGEVRTQYMDVPGDTCKDTTGPCAGPHPHDPVLLLTSTFITVSATHPSPIPPIAWDCMSKTKFAFALAPVFSGLDFHISVCKTILVRTYVYFHLQFFRPTQVWHSDFFSSVVNWSSVEGCHTVEAVNTRAVSQTKLREAKNDRAIVWSFKSSH